ncbi:MAG: LSU ribosomal protein L13p (L13Ae), partial [uncultured Frankineae bacterium]
AHVHPQARRHHPRLARHRRRGHRARPAGQPGGHAAARQAQAVLRTSPRHRRLRGHRQRGQGRDDGQEGRAVDGLPPLRLPGWPQAHVVRRRPRDPSRADRREGHQGDAAAQHPRPADALQAEGLRRSHAPPPGAGSCALRAEAGLPV